VGEFGRWAKRRGLQGNEMEENRKKNYRKRRG
jgi:hypothetical protein